MMRTTIISEQILNVFILFSGCLLGGMCIGTLLADHGGACLPMIFLTLGMIWLSFAVYFYEQEKIDMEKNEDASSPKNTDV